MPEMLAQAQAHLQAGETAAATLSCGEILRRWPGQGDAHHLLGLLAHSRHELPAALAHFRAAAAAPLSPGLYAANLAELCRLQGLLTEGEAAGRQAVARAPNLPAAWNNLGIILQEAGKFEESRDCLQRLLQLQPANAEGHNNLGNTLKRLGDHPGATLHWRRALTLRPDYAQPHSNLCCLLGETGEFAQARDHGRRAVELAPQLADAYVNLAGLETAEGNIEASMRWLDALLAFAPAHPGGLSALAIALKKHGSIAEAKATALRAVAASPRNAEAWNALGLVQQELGATDEALACFDRAATLPGVAAEQALTNRALVFMEHGRAAEAEAAFDHALAAFPQSASIWFNRADLQKFSAGDPAIAQMQTLLENAPRNDQILLHFALGKAYLDVGNGDAAFRHLNAGNAMKRKTFAYDPDITALTLRRIAEVFSADLLAARKNAGPASAMPVFILGMPRSGTTLAEQILASHSALHGAGELAHLQSMVTALPGFPDGITAMTDAELHALGRRYLEQVAPLAKGKPYVIDKMPANFAYAGLIRLILPGARIIHCRRDAVDTCLSCYSKLFSGEQRFAYDQSELGLFYNSYETLTSHWRAILPPENYLELHYEALVADPEAQTRRMLAFLGLEFEPACLEFHRSQRQVRTASLNQVRQPVYTAAVGRWRGYAAQLAPLMAALGRRSGDTRVS